jgi:hypothetical protein
MQFRMIAYSGDKTQREAAPPASGLTIYEAVFGQ